MATTTLSGTDLSNLRGNEQYIDEVAIHITPKTSVATGTVTSVPVFSPYVQVGITWDGSFADVAIGQLVEITSGSTLKAYGIVRKEPTSGILYISTTPLGSAGYASLIENAIAVSDTVTVYSHHPLWGLPSRIADRTFFKQWDVAYTNQNSQPPPVSNVGTWQASKVSTGESSSFTLPRGGANTSFALGSATISSYSWSLPSGVTLSGGSLASDSVITVTATPGTYQVSCTVTDSNGNAHTAYTWLFVSDGTTGTSLSERYAVEIVSDEQTVEGRTVSIVITGENLENVLYPGAGILLREWSVFNGNTLTDGVLIDSFVGYISEVEIAHDGNVGTANVLIESPFIYAQRIPQPSQVVEESVSPANWSQATSTLTNPQGFLYYAIKWHAPALLDMHDLDAPYTTPRRKNAVWQKGSLASAMTKAAEYIAGSIGSTSDGTTVLRTNPVYMNNADRNALENIITWLERDLQAPFNYINRFNQPLNEARTGAFAYNGTTVKAWLGGKFWGQGTGSATLPNFAVTTTEGLNRILEVVGHFYAEQNRNILEIPIALTRNQDIIDPALWLWCSLTVSSDFDTLGNGFTSQRCLVKNITREWVNDSFGIRKGIQLGLQPETFGQPGEEIPIQNAAAYQLGGYSITIPTNFAPDQDDSAFGGVPIMIVNAESGDMAITYNYQVSSPVWTNLRPALDDETVHDFTIDFDSPYFSNGNNASYALRAYAVTSSGGSTLNIWRFNDILTTPVASLLESVSMNDSSCTSEARIENGETNPNLVIVAWHDRSGVAYVRSVDSGATWSSPANVGSSITDTANDNAVLGLDVDGEYQLITAPDAGSSYGAYLATTEGGSFTRLTNSESSGSPYTLIKVDPETSELYASTTGGGFDLMSFEGGEDIILKFIEGTSRPSVINGGIGVGSGTPSPSLTSSGGNPGQCLKLAPTSGISSSGGWSVGPAFDLYTVDDAATLANIKFDYYVSSDAISEGVVITVYVQGTGLSVSTWEVSSLVADTWTTVDVNADGGSALFPVSIGDVAPTSEIYILAGNLSQTDFSVSSIDVRFDNIKIYQTPTIGGSSAGSLYKVTDFDGTDVWTEINPGSAERPHDLAIDIADPNLLKLHVASTGVWYTSDDAGTIWTSQGVDTERKTFQSAGNTIAVGGTDTIALSLDGTTFENKTGNLTSAISSFEGVKRIQAL